MIASATLDLAIGLSLLFVVFSLIVTATKEAIESIMKKRARDMYAFLGDILRDVKSGDFKSLEAVRAFYDHPDIFALFKGDFATASKGQGKGLPSYIPNAAFASAVIDLFEDPGAKLPADSVLSKAVIALKARAKGDVDRLKADLATWFDSGMERVGGAYKRNAQYVTFLLGFALAAAFNLNPIIMANEMLTSPTKREAIVAYATSLAQKGETVLDIKEVTKEVDNLGVPVGWTPTAKVTPSGMTVTEAFGSAWSFLLAAVYSLAGFGIMAIAGTLGAPFWFDFLNKFVNIRATLKGAQTGGAPPVA